jgi:hypothetical protein
MSPYLPICIQIFLLGKRPEVENEVTCQSMKRSGITQNGLYPLRNAQDQYPRLALCNMESTDGYEDVTMEKAMGYLDPRTLPGGVLFSASIRPESGWQDISSGALIFNKIHLNIGNGFSQETGIFTVPMTGTYRFTFSSESARTLSATSIGVNKNGVLYSYIHDGNVADNYNNMSYVWVMFLNASDTIQLSVGDNGIYTDSNRETTFSGELVDQSIY